MLRSYFGEVRVFTPNPGVVKLEVVLLLLDPCYVLTYNRIGARQLIEVICVHHALIDLVKLSLSDDIIIRLEHSIHVRLLLLQRLFDEELSVVIQHSSQMLSHLVTCDDGQVEHFLLILFQLILLDVKDNEIHGHQCIIDSMLRINNLCL